MKYKVPQGMKQAALDAERNIVQTWSAQKLSMQGYAEEIAEAVCGWMDGELEKMVKHPQNNFANWYHNEAIRAVRRMFAAPQDPDAPIRHLLWMEDVRINTNGECVNDRLRDCYRIGLEQGRKDSK